MVMPCSLLVWTVVPSDAGAELVHAAMVGALVTLVECHSNADDYRCDPGSHGQ
jgi:hypothetical protein